MNLEALAVALENRPWPVPVDRVRCQRIRTVQGTGEDGEPAVWFEADQAGIGNEAIVFVDGFPLPHIRDVRRFRVSRIFSIELLEENTAEEVAEMLAPPIEEKFLEAK
jgi:hypothetical protein